MNNKLKKLTYSALLAAFSIVIPLYFGFLKVYIPPFSATITSHVPMFISMFLGPEVAVLVGLASAVGFFLTSPPFVGARAFTHVFVGLAGAYLYRKGMSFKKIVLVTSIIHGLLESLVVLPFGFNIYNSFIVVGVGTIIHHLIDGSIASIVLEAVVKKDRACAR